jgi:hypothetical protein
METTLQELRAERRDWAHILVVEGDAEIGGILAEMLAGSGMRAVLATSIHEMQAAWPVSPSTSSSSTSCCPARTGSAFAGD